MDSIKADIDREVDALADELNAVSDFLLANPETAYQEFKACTYLSRFLTDHGFTVDAKPGGLETAFLARPNGHETGRPAVAILAEYDALPKIGHGCGHNLIAAASMGAALALQRLEKLPGAFAVVGTPAEEGGGGKAKLADAGVFDGLDVAMMFHPGQQNIPGKDMLGRIKFKMEFFGRTAHASGTPDRGLNALDALVLAYTSINAFRQHLRPDGRVHGIITHGGDAPNIIPDYAAGLFYVRAGTRAYRDEIFERVQACARGAALATGTRCEITVEPPTIDPFKRNAALEAAAAANMQALGLSIDPDDGRRGSSDIGNLSHVLPAIHPGLAIVGSDIPGHSVAFAEATTSERGRKTVLLAARLLARTAYDYLASPGLREEVQQEFRQPEKTALT